MFGLGLGLGAGVGVGLGLGLGLGLGFGLGLGVDGGAALRVLCRVASVEDRGAAVEDPLAVEGSEAAQQEQPALLRGLRPAGVLAER